MIQRTPAAERPRERCLSQGASALSLRECLAVLLGSGQRGKGCLGLARDILSRYGDGFTPKDEERAFFKAMEASPATGFGEVRGLGEAGLARLLAAFELGRRYALFRQRSKGSRASGVRLDRVASRTLAKLPELLRIESKEWLGFVPLYRADDLGELCLVERGARTHVNVDPSEFFARLLALRPKGFVLFHNHLSGNLSPSDADLQLTAELRRLAESFGIALVGHWIVGPSSELWIE